MFDQPEFEDMLANALDMIDRVLADCEVPLWERPLRAARDFVKHFIIKIRIGEEEREPSAFMEFAGSEWFKMMHARTVAWYSSRYGEAMNCKSGQIVNGCTMVLGTPFVLHVPVVTKRPGSPGETIWVCFPNEVEDDEDSMAWIENAPNIASLPRGDGMKARRLANEVAGAIRSIQTSLATVEDPSGGVAALRDAIVQHLDTAAVLIAKARPEQLKHAQWDLQMACEKALKLLSDQRHATFPETHDLYYLFDQLPGDRPFKREWLGNVPNWERMAEWRYGRGLPISLADAFSRYRSTLKIVRATADAAEHKLHIGGASIELKRAPYLHEDPEMYLPRIAAPVRGSPTDND